MTVYQLNRKEAWVLATLINLPIQEDTIIGAWLGSDDVPAFETIQSWTPQVTNTLAGKGYLRKVNAEYQFPDEFLNALLLMALGQEVLTVRLRIMQEAGETSFVLSGTGLVQYGFQDDRLVLHQPRQLDEMLPVLLPDWIKVSQYEGSSTALTLDTFLLFRQACLMQDMAYVINDEDDTSFRRAELVETFLRDYGWLDVYHALGLESAPELFDVDLAEGIRSLIEKGFLNEPDNLKLTIGSQGEPLYQALADPNYVTVTIGLASVPRDETITSVFLAGAERLFLLSLNGRKLTLRQLRSHTAGILELHRILKPV